MIRWVYRGQRVHLRYAAKKRAATVGLHLARGVVVVAASGPGPHNCLVALDDGRQVVVTRGQMNEGAGPGLPAQTSLFD